MKTKRVWNGRSFLSAWLFGAVLSGAALSCPVTTYELPVSLNFLWLVCVVAAGLLSLLWHLPGRAVTLPCAAVAYGGGLWWFREPVARGFSAALERITDCYATAYPNLSVLSLGEVPPDTDASLCFAALAILMITMVVWVVAQRLSIWPALLWCGFWLGTCLVVVDELPAMWAMLALLAAGLLLMLTQRARQEDPGAAFRLTWLLALPVAVLVVGLARLQPPATYTRAAWPDEWQTQLNAQITRLSGVEFGTQGAIEWDSRFQTGSSVWWKAGTEAVDLSQLGPRRQNRTKWLEVRADMTGHLYLRGASLASYVNNRWQPLSLSTQQGVLYLGRQEPEHGVDIRTQTVQPVLYAAYYPSQMPCAMTGDAFYENAGELQEYTVWYDSSPGLQAGPMDAIYTDVQMAQTVYTLVPEQTREGLLQLAEEAGLTAIPAEKLPDAVAAYVRDAAEYNLNVQKMPEDRDFVLWFLTESREGYCVHFATATALMLRTLGIPARYVTGFVAETQANRWTDVTEADAHAWVEYYQEDFGWVPLESTPGDGRVAGTVAAPETPEEPEPPEESEQPEQPKPPDVPEEPEQTEPVQPALPEKSAPAPDAAARSWAWLGWTLLALSLTAALIASRWLRLAYRRGAVRGKPNAQALILWRQLVRLSRHAGVEPPAALETLAQKARFSQHQLTPEELAQLREHNAALETRLRRERGLWRRLQIRWFWADC